MYNCPMDMSGAVPLSPGRKTKVVEETNIGMYVWEMPDGKWVGDDEGHFMHIVSMRGDERRIAQLTDAARGYGIQEGKPVFLSGHRPVTDEEYEEQRQRLALGLTPDPDDIPSLVSRYKRGEV